MKNIFLITLLIIGFTCVPQYTDAASIKVTSPAKGSEYYFGGQLPVKWTEKSQGVASIKIVHAERGVPGGVGIYGPMVFGDPVTYKGKIDYTLPDYLITPPGQYKIELVTADGQTVYGPIFTLNSANGEPITQIKKAKFKFGSVSEFSKKYKKGEQIDFNIEAWESKNIPADSARGFHIQTHIFDSKNRTGGAYQAVNAQYDVQTAQWNVRMTAPSDSKSYIAVVTLYCGDVGIHSYCAKTYGANAQLKKILNFKVR